MTDHERQLDGYQEKWVQTRLDWLAKRFGTAFFVGKKILELGPCNGRLGATLGSWGAHVTAIEGRQENIDYIRKRFPWVQTIHANLDTSCWDWGSDWDIALSFGLIYHLQHWHASHIRNCLKNCNLFLLESVVFDSELSQIYYREESGLDQSLSGIGGTPTRAFVEDCFGDKQFELIEDLSLNAGDHCYSWIELNSGVLNEYYRRMWIVHCRPEEADGVTVCTQSSQADPA